MTDDLGAVLSAIAETAAETIAAEAERTDRTREFPSTSLRALGAAGGLGLVIPAGQGGAGGGLATLAEACESVGAACASTGMVFLMHQVTAAVIARGGGQAAAELLPAMASGEAIGTLAFSERGTGAHFYAPELRAVRSDGSLELTGSKSFVTSGGHADVYLVLVQSEDNVDGTDIYALRKSDPGVAFVGDWNGLGMAGNSSIALQLEDVRLEEEQRIGNPGRATELVFGVVAPFFLVGLAAVNVGIAAAAAQSATAHAVERGFPDGSRLVDVQYIQHAIAGMDLTLRQARLLVHEAARLADEGDERALLALMEAKVAATDAAVAVTSIAMSVTGGQGYTTSLPIERHFRDAQAGAVMAPTNAVLRNWIGKALAGLPVP